jgi:hypothetical protein
VLGVFTRYQPIKNRLAFNLNLCRMMEGEFLMSLPSLEDAAIMPFTSTAGAMQLLMGARYRTRAIEIL